MRIHADEYRSLDLRAHALLRGVRLLDVSAVDLPGGGEDRTLTDVRAAAESAGPGVLASLLFGTRRALGRLFGWDRTGFAAEESLAARLSEEERRRSEVPPGMRVGGFVVVYQLPREALLEIRNRTVHGWVCAALVPRGRGYRLYLAVYVERVSWVTRPYLAAIEPFRRILYPSMLGRIRRAWAASVGSVERASSRQD